MSTYQEAVSQAVKKYLAESHHPQRIIAEVLSVTQGQISQRISGKVAWSLCDVERLHAALGIEVPLPALVGAK